MTEPHWIGPHLLENFFGKRFPDSLSFEDKVIIFSDTVQGWQLDVADRLLRNDRHAGFAALSVVLSYFEMIARYRDGRWEYERDSAERFKDGVRWVYSDLPDPGVLDPLWETVRNGMYHRATTKRGVVLDGEFPVAIELKGSTVEINPHLLVRDLQQHFGRYVADLLDASQEELRTNFQTVFDSWKKWGA
ncbi:MAG: hypothetical protein ABSG55_01790 [Dehalococcoidia bacterium]|jgi:hypothetical protein